MCHDPLEPDPALGGVEPTELVQVDLLEQLAAEERDEPFVEVAPARRRARGRGAPSSTRQIRPSRDRPRHGCLTLDRHGGNTAILGTSTWSTTRSPRPGDCARSARWAATLDRGRDRPVETLARAPSRTAWLAPATAHVKAHSWSSTKSVSTTTGSMPRISMVELPRSPSRLTARSPPVARP
ncbi:hypothetical protein NKG05_16725 [Oerskovia sp. M15]